MTDEEILAVHFAQEHGYSDPLPHDRAKARAVLAALATAGKHIVGEGEGVIDGQRGRLIDVNTDEYEVPADGRWSFVFVPSLDPEGNMQ